MYTLCSKNIIASGTFSCRQKSCFPSAAEVKIKNGKSVQMFELQIGDRVQAGMT